MDTNDKRREIKDRVGRFAAPILLFVLLITIYSFTLLPGVGYSGDTAKWQFVGRVLGIPHTTCYPTYILLNHFFTKLFPIGTVAYRANLLSAVFAAGACLVLYYLLLLLNLNKRVAFFCSLIFGLTASFWSQAVVAEVYTLNLLFVALVFYLLLQWRQTRRRIHLIGACAVYAISFGNHLTMITLLPAIFYLVWSTDRTVFSDPKVIVPVAFLILAGALQYSYLFWRSYSPDPAYLELHTPNLKRFWNAVTGAGFKRKMFVYSLQEILTQRTPMYGKFLLRQYYFLIPLAIYGWFQIKDRIVNTFLLLAYAGNLIYALNYDIQDISVYFIPGYLVLMIYIASGLNAIRFLHRKVLGGLSLAVFPAILLAANYNDVDQSKSTREAMEARAIFQSLENNAVIITNYRFSQYFWYYMLAENPQKKRIYILRILSPQAVIEYLERKTPLLVREVRKKVPYGSQVYCQTEPYIMQLKQKGFSLKQVRRNLCQVSR